jgi:DinB family protein
MPITIAIARPAPDEHIPYYSKYIDLVPGDDALPALESQIVETRKRLAGLPEERALHRYAPGKWSVKETIGHLADTERVFAYRALHVARGDRTPLPGFDENQWAPEGRFDERPFADLLDEFGAVRAASLALFRSLDPERLRRTGLANDASISVRALAWNIAGHELHHRNILRERYGIG